MKLYLFCSLFLISQAKPDLHGLIVAMPTINKIVVESSADFKDVPVYLQAPADLLKRQHTEMLSYWRQSLIGAPCQVKYSRAGAPEVFVRGYKWKEPRVFAPQNIFDIARNWLTLPKFPADWVPSRYTGKIVAFSSLGAATIMGKDGGSSPVTVHLFVPPDLNGLDSAPATRHWLSQFIGHLADAGLRAEKTNSSRRLFDLYLLDDPKLPREKSVSELAETNLLSSPDQPKK